MVVYPPVDLANFRQYSKNENRDDMVVTVSRIRLGKHLETVPKVAKRVKKARFTIIGLADPGSQDTIRTLEKTINELGVEDRVKILVNQPFQKLVEILSSSKALLNTQPMEAFGMAVVEAMATGCVPIVPRSGGPWYDILDRRQGEYGYAYRNIGEAADIINMLLRNEKSWGEVSLRGRKRADDFDSLIFEKRILSLVDMVNGKK
jgi:glycosyltransferase involved in cell wall biosynthesis